MIQVPFTSDKFSAEMKPLISGIDLSLEYENIESSMTKTAVDIATITGQSTYDKLIGLYQTNTANLIYQSGIDYLQRAMLHFAIYEHQIFLIAHISNDGILIKKTDTEVPIFKYTSDELNQKLLGLGWFWMNLLLRLFSDNPNLFPEWIQSDQKKAYDDIPIGITDFEKWVGVLGGQMFLMYAGWIVQEVWIDCVESRIFPKPILKTDKISRAVCYEVMARACQRLAYSCLPEPIRRDIDNEMGKNHRAQADKDIREHVSVKFASKAETYWNALDLEIKKKEIEANKKNMGDQPIIGQKDIYEEDKFYYS